MQRPCAAVALCEQHGIYLLVDETYREMTFGPLLPSAATLSRRAISVSSLSKTYGLPGLRLGWAVTRDPALYQTLLAAKGADSSVTIVDEKIAAQAPAAACDLAAGDQGPHRRRLHGRPRLHGRQDALEWVEPMGGVVGFPRVRSLEGARDKTRRTSTSTASTPRSATVTPPPSAPDTGSSSRATTCASATAGQACRALIRQVLPTSPRRLPMPPLITVRSRAGCKLGTGLTYHVL